MGGVDPLMLKNLNLSTGWEARSMTDTDRFLALFLEANSGHMDDIVTFSFAVAIRMKSGYVGPEHTLLGLLEGHPDPRAGEILRRVAVERASLEEWFTSHIAAPELEPEQGVPAAPRELTPKASPAFYWTIGRGEGLAAARHEGEPDSLDVLFAFLTKRRANSNFDVWRPAIAEQGVSAGVILEAIASEGVPIPPGCGPE